MLNIPFYKLASLNKPFKKKIISKISEIIDSGYYINSRNTLEFEKKFSEFCSAKYCIAVGNGFDALAISFRACKELNLLKDGDEIIVPANTYIASILSITHENLIPILVEPDIQTFNIDANKIDEKITKNTKAILVVHLYGQAANMDPILKLSKKYNLLVLEDCAQAHGASFKGKSVGTFGIAGAFSFFPGKNLGAMGDAGAVVSNNKKIINVISRLRNYGEKQYKKNEARKYLNEYIGRNSRLDEFQAAVLNIKLKSLKLEMNARNKIANLYLKYISNPNVILPELNKNCSHVWHLFVIRVKDRVLFRQYLLSHGIHTLIHYPIPPHKQKAYKNIFHDSFPITEQIHKEVVSIPLNSALSLEEIQYIINTINSYKPR